jgi:hypothetical protein
MRVAVTFEASVQVKERDGHHTMEELFELLQGCCPKQRLLFSAKNFCANAAQQSHNVGIVSSHLKGGHKIHVGGV